MIDCVRGGLAAALLLAGAKGALAMPEYTADGSSLTGILDLEADGKLYDLTFVTGRCTELFDGCDGESDFFVTEAEAEAITQAMYAILVNGIVVDGALLQRGMPVFDELDDDDLDAIRHYVRFQARKAIRNDTKTAGAIREP